MSTTSFFQEALSAVPKDVATQVNWSFAIADKIDARLKELGITQKQFAHKMGKTEAEVSKWLGGTHNFTLRTLSKISSVLDEDMIHI